MSGRASRTATKIARFMVLLDAVPRFHGLLPEGAARAAEQIVRGSGVVPARQVDAMRAPSTRRLYAITERLLGRGQLLWFGVRKRWMADQVAAAMAAGARQLAVVGAGFDPLAALTARAYPELLAVEIDAPATAEPKKRGVEHAGLSRPNHHVIAADLAQRPLAEVLASTPWRPELPSVVVAEGVLMYLAPADVEAFFMAVRASTGAGSRLAFSALAADARGRPHIGALDAPIRLALRLAGEPMRWGIRPGDVPDYLERKGFRALEQPDAAALHARYLDPLDLQSEPLRPYEHLVLAGRLAH